MTTLKQFWSHESLNSDGFCSLILCFLSLLPFSVCKLVTDRNQQTQNPFTELHHLELELQENSLLNKILLNKNLESIWNMKLIITKLSPIFVPIFKLQYLKKASSSDARVKQKNNFLKTKLGLVIISPSMSWYSINDHDECITYIMGNLVLSNNS